MRFSHHNLLVELNDEWWSEAEMSGFAPQCKAYRAPGSYKGQHVQEVPIADIGPLHRASIFKDDLEEEHKTARERVLRLLRGFRAGDSIPPVEIVDSPPGYGFPYKLTHGAHRLYCSLASGFTHVPIIKGVDWHSL